MGGAVGLASQVDFQVQFHSIFVDNDIREAEALLKTNQYARRSFLEFIEGKSWAEMLDIHGRVASEIRGPETIWKKFGYNDPYISAGITQSLSFSTFSSPHMNKYVADAGDSTRTTAPEAVNSLRKWSVFDHRELRAVLCFALWPFYRNSSSYRALHEPLSSSSTDEAASAAAVMTSSQKLKMSISRFQRLRELLLGTVALMDMKNFNRYLADTTHSWIEDFKAALLNLPLTLMVSGIQADRRRSQVAFINNDPQNSFSSKWMQEDPLSWSGAVGRDLHVLCAVDLCSEYTKQVETAIFNGKGYKVALTDGKGCKLRAVKPIFSASGAYVYALALETAVFENPKHLQELGMFAQSEKQFHQVEDLLALLPLLIKA